MKIRTTRLLAKEGVYNVYKNKLMSFASLVTVVATLFILGLVLLIVVNVTTNLEDMKRNLEVTVFLKPDASILEKEDVALFIQQNKDAGIITEYRHETKQQAYDYVKNEFKDESLLKGLSPDQFPEGYWIKLKNPDYSGQFIAKVSLMNGVDKKAISYPKKDLDKLSGLLKVFNYVTVFILIALMIISVLLISNTIRLTVFARRREIEIMKYVGALDWFIRLPFIVEGMVIGFIGAILSYLLTSQAYSWIKDGLNTIFLGLGLPDLKLIEFSPVALRVMFIFVIFGVTIGMIGSFMSVRKHLNV